MEIYRSAVLKTPVRKSSSKYRFMKINQLYKLILADDHILLRDALANLINKFEEFNVTAVAGNGKEWDSLAWITDDDLLKVKGYWLFFSGNNLFVITAPE